MKFYRPTLRPKKKIAANLIAILLIASVLLMGWGVVSLVAWLIPSSWEENAAQGFRWLFWAAILYWLIPNSFITWKKK